MTGSIFLIKQHRGAAEKYQVEKLKEYKIRPSSINPVIQDGSSDDQNPEGNSSRGLLLLTVILLFLVVLAVVIWYLRQRMPEYKRTQAVFNEKA